MTHDATLERIATLERESSWTEAASLYADLIVKQSSSATEIRAQLQARYAYALFRAAFQAEAADTYRRLMEDSREAEKQAAGLYSAAGLKVRERYHLARVELAEYYLTVKREQALSALDRALSLLDEAIALYRKEDDALGEGEALALWLEIAGWCSWLYPRTAKLKLREGGEEYAQRALIIADTVGDLRLRAHVLTWLGLLVHHCRSESRSQDEERSIQLAKQAVQLFKDVDDPRGAFWANCAASLTLEPGIRDAMQHATEALYLAKRLRDKHLISVGLRGTIYMLRWQLVVMEDAEEAEIVLRQIQGYFAELEASLLPSADTLVWQMTIHGDVTQAYTLVAQLMADLPRRKSLLEMGIQQGLEAMELSDHYHSKSYLAFALGLAHSALATVESSRKRKRELLERAASYHETAEQGFLEEPSFYWNIGLNQARTGQVLSELSELENDSEAKTTILKQSSQKLENGIEECLREPILSEGQFLRLGQLSETNAKVLQALRTLGKELPTSKSIPDMWRHAADFYKRGGQLSRVAQTYWQIALEHDTEQRFSKSVEAYVKAATAFQQASEKVPSLTMVFRDYAIYMRGWAKVAEARLAHDDEDYDKAEQQYLEAAEIFGGTKRWTHLQPHYVACASLESGEKFGQKEQPETALKSFMEATTNFDQTLSQLASMRRTIGSEEARTELERWIKVTDGRKRYSLARADVEEAKLLDQSGQRSASARKFEDAAGIFEQLERESETTSDAVDFRVIALLCHGWAEMKHAEALASPNRFTSAAQFFLQAKESTKKEKAGLLKLGKVAMCKALEMGTRFKSSRDNEFFAGAKRNLETAATYYLDAGHEGLANWARATERLLDAFVYLDRAEAELDSRRRGELYASAEKHLESARSLFSKAGYARRLDEVERHLQHAREERETLLPISTSGGLALTAAASQLPPPALTLDRALGIERLEGAFLMADMLITKREARVGDELECEIQIVNAGRLPALLARIQELLPPKCELSKKPDKYAFENNTLQLKGRRLDPLRKEEIHFSIKFLKAGKLLLQPRVLYADETGQFRVTEAEPIELQVQEPLPAAENRVPTGFPIADRLLLGGLPKQTAVLLNSPTCNERDELVRAFCGVTSTATVYVSSNINESQKLNNLYPQLRLVVCSPHSGYLPKTTTIQTAPGFETLSDINIALIRALETITCEEKRIYLQLTSDVLLFHKALTTRRWLSDLLPRLRARQCTIMAELNPQMHAAEEVHSLSDLFDGRLELVEREEAGRSRRSLRVATLRGHLYLQEEVSLATS